MNLGLSVEFVDMSVCVTAEGRYDGIRGRKMTVA